MQLSEPFDRFALTSMEILAWRPPSVSRAEDVARSYLLGRGDVRQLALEPIKDGRTATTFRARVVTRDASTVLAIRVARDATAAPARLRALAVDLRAWHATAPGAAAAVIDHGEVRGTAILATTWIDGDPLRVTGEAWHRGRERLSVKQAQRVVEALAWKRSRLALFDARGVCEREVDLQRGDVVIDGALGVTLVGSAARTWCGRLGAWPYRLAAGAPLAPAAAVAAGVEALRTDPRLDVRLMVPRMIADALTFEPPPGRPRDEIVEAVRDELGR